MSYGPIEKMRRLRKQILEILQSMHDERSGRLDSSTLWSLVVRIGFDASKNQILTVCEDLEARGYIKYQLNRKLFEKTGDRLYMQIELCPRGRDVLEGTISDPAVEG